MCAGVFDALFCPFAFFCWSRLILKSEYIASARPLRVHLGWDQCLDCVRQLLRTAIPCT